MLHRRIAVVVGAATLVLAAAPAAAQGPPPPVEIVGCSPIVQGTETVLTVADPIAGATYRWFNTANNSLVFTGTSFSTPVLNANLGLRVERTLPGGGIDDTDTMLVAVALATADTTTAVTATPSPSIPGQPVTFAATVSPPPFVAGPVRGPLRFTVDGVEQAPVRLDGAGQASITVPSLGVGAHTVAAAYGTGCAFPSSDSADHEVRREVPQLGVVSSLQPSTVGQSVTFTATLTAANPTGGTISFTDDGQAMPGCAALAVTDDVASCTVPTLTAGRHRIAATFSGNDLVAPANAEVVQDVAGLVARLTAAPASRLLPTYRATLTDVAGAPLAGRSVRFPGCAAVTDGAGVAQCGVLTVVLFGSSYTATFAGDATYAATSAAGRYQLVVGLF